MSKKLYEETNLQAIGNAIREKLGGNATYLPSEMASAIGQIHGEPALETLSVNQNGTYTPAQGKDGFSSVSVAVPSGGGILIPKNIIQNGTYNALSDDSADGYSEVTVNVPIPETGEPTITGFYTKNISSAQEIVHEFETAGEYTVIIALIQNSSIDVLSIMLNNEDISSSLTAVGSNNYGNFYYYTSIFDSGDVITCSNIQNVGNHGMQLIVIEGSFDVNLIACVSNGGSFSVTFTDNMYLIVYNYGYNRAAVVDTCLLLNGSVYALLNGGTIRFSTVNASQYWYGGGYALELQST